jgi:mono/diheme cytochrome c family protein
MRKDAMNTVKTLLTISLLMSFLVNCEKKSPAPQFFPDMYDSPAREAQEFDPTSPDGFGSRIPPEGTIPVEFEPYVHDELSLYDIKGKELKLPDTIKPTLANYEKGEQQFQIFCTPCHGVRGEGNGSVIGPSGKFSYNPNLHLHKGLGKTMSDGEIFHVITKGNGQMPSYGSQILPEDRWKIILYVRKLQAAYDKMANMQKGDN